VSDELHALSALYLGNFPVSTGQEDGWFLQPVWNFFRREIFPVLCDETTIPAKVLVQWWFSDIPEWQ
jgi:hypothetical protein